MVHASSFSDLLQHTNDPLLLSQRERNPHSPQFRVFKVSSACASHAVGSSGKRSICCSSLNLKLSRQTSQPTCTSSRQQDELVLHDVASTLRLDCRRVSSASQVTTSLFKISGAPLISALAFIRCHCTANAMTMTERMKSPSPRIRSRCIQLAEDNPKLECC